VEVLLASKEDRTPVHKKQSELKPPASSQLEAQNSQIFSP
jgi:hypothetical protein